MIFIDPGTDATFGVVPIDHPELIERVAIAIYSGEWKRADATTKQIARCRAQNAITTFLQYLITEGLCDDRRQH